MKKVLCSSLVWFFVATPLIAQQPLPIRRILLYKNGMAYIVRAGELRSPLSLTFHPEEMNDVLKSFTAWNPDSSTLYAVGYTTGIPATHILTRFPFDLLRPKSGLAGFLDQVQGADVRLKMASRTISGRLVSINEEDRASRQGRAKEHRLTLLLAHGNLNTVWLSDGAYPILEIAPGSANVEVTVAADSLPLLATSSSSVSLRPSDVADLFTEAEVSQIRDFFEYRIAFPVRLASRQSALLPFLNSPMRLERVSIFDAESETAHPLLGAWLENNSGVPLDSGPVTFFQEGRYAGESILEHTALSERRLVRYGLDYDVEVAYEKNTPKETTTRLTASRGIVKLYRERLQTTTYQLKNRSSDHKVVLIEHPRLLNGTLRDLSPDEITPDYYRFRVELEPRAELTLPVTEASPRENVIAITTSDRARLEVELSGVEVPAALNSKINEIVAARENLSDLKKQREPLDARINAIVQDQTRLRENLKALRDSKEEKDLRQKYLDGLAAQEQQINELRAKVNDLLVRISEQESAVAKMISELNWD